MKVHHAALVIASLVWASTASADDGALSQSSSSGSVNVSVYIPPLGAAIAAAKAGAVGLWSVSGRNNGLMIQLHKATDKPGFDAVSVFSRAEVGVETAWQADGVPAPAAFVRNERGLIETRVPVPTQTAPVRTLMIRGI